MPTRQQIINRINKQDWRNTDSDILNRVFNVLQSAAASLFGEAKAPREIEYTDHRGQRVPIGFLQWWRVYPNKKGGILKCAQVWLDKGLEVRAQEMVDAVNAQKKARNQQQDAGEFVPEWKYALYWLKDERWTDELSAGEGGGPRTARERLDALPPALLADLHQRATSGEYPGLEGLPITDFAVRGLMVEMAQERGAM